MKVWGGGVYLERLLHVEPSSNSREEIRADRDMYNAVRTNAAQDCAAIAQGEPCMSQTFCSC